MTDMIIRSRWPMGFFGQALEPDWPGCNIELPGVNWGEILPYRAQNFWTGSTTCPKKDKLATWDRDGTFQLLMCQDKAKILALPRTEFFTKEQKEYKVFQSATFNETTQVKWTGQPMNITLTDALLVQCGDEENLFVRNFRRQEVVDRVKKISIKKKLNTLIIYMDAVSRRHFFRRFPKTTAFLSSMRDQGFSAKLHQFFRYHSVGITTKPNARTLFTGTQYGEYTTFRSHLPFRSPQTTDTVLWEEFYRGGYVTAVLDNSCHDWAVRYTRNLARVDVELVAPFCLPESYPLDDPHSNFQGPFSIRRRCLAGKYVHSYVYNYLAEFWQSYR